MAVVAFALICALVIGVPLYLGMTRWSSRADRKAAEARRRASAAYYVDAVTPRPDPQRPRRAFNP
jgi:hypothetical protein